jgi:anthranilate phosphoribosyltransferase
MAQVLMARGIEYAILVHADDGLDELSLGAASTLHVITPGTSTVQRLDAGESLERHHDVTAIRGGDIDVNVRAVRSFLGGEPGPVFDVACANAGLALMVAGRVDNIRDGYDVAAKSVLEGHAQHALERLVELSNV